MNRRYSINALSAFCIAIWIGCEKKEYCDMVRYDLPNTAYFVKGTDTITFNIYKLPANKFDPCPKEVTDSLQKLEVLGYKMIYMGPHYYEYVLCEDCQRALGYNKYNACYPH